MTNMNFTAVGDMLVQRRIPHDYPGFAEIRDYVLRGDARYFNLETTLHHGQHFGGQFFGGSFLHADPRVLEDAEAMGFNMLSFVNNHTMDFSYGGMLSTLEAVEQSGFVHAGVGRNLDDAAAPRYLETGKGRIALIACTSLEPKAASAMAGRQSRQVIGRPGLNGLRCDDEVCVTPEEFAVLEQIAAKSHVNAQQEIERAEGYHPALPEGVLTLKNLRFVKGEETRYVTRPMEADMKRIERAIYEAEMRADYILVAIHSHQLSGDSKENPSDMLQEFAHRCIDAGAHAVIGHGPHLLRPIEIYKQRPIFYSLGDFVLQNELLEAPAEDMFELYGMTSDTTLRDLFYARSKGYQRGLLCDRRMQEAVIPYFEMEDGRLTSLELLPIDLGVGEARWRIGLPRPAAEPESIMERLARLSAPFGTVIRKDENGVYRVELPKE